MSKTQTMNAAFLLPFVAAPGASPAFRQNSLSAPPKHPDTGLRHRPHLSGSPATKSNLLGTLRIRTALHGAGMALFNRDLRILGLFSTLERLFGSIRKLEKRFPIPVFSHQIICFFPDGRTTTIAQTLVGA